jgi:hypothetical protein
MIGIERVLGSVGHDDVRLQISEAVHQLFQSGIGNDKGIITQIQATEGSANNPGCFVGLLVADALDVLHRLVRVLPQCARFPSLPIGKRDHGSTTSPRGDKGNGPPGSPDEISRVCPDDEKFSATHPIPPSAKTVFRQPTRNSSIRVLICPFSSPPASTQTEGATHPAP